MLTTELKLPDLGGDVTDVTITRWRVQEGASIQAGDILLEVATDKVDTEVPATISGTLLKRLVSEGELVPVSTVLGTIGQMTETTTDDRPATAQTTADYGPTTAEEPDEKDASGAKATPVAQRMADEAGVSLGDVIGTGPGGRITKKDVMAAAQKDNGREPKAAGDDRRQTTDQRPATASPAKSAGAALPGELSDETPLAVRRLAAEHNLNLREVAAGRPLSTLTKYDVLSFIASRAAGETVTVRPRTATTDRRPPTTAKPEPPSAESGAPSTPPRTSAGSEPASVPAPAGANAPTTLKPGEEFVPHSRNRLLTARATARAAQTIPHVTTWWDVNMATVLAHRKAHKDEFAAQGVNLTVTAYLLKATVAGLKAVPQASSTWTDEGLILKHSYNIGMAVALAGGGLIVPVIKNGDDLSLLGVARAVNEVAERGRAGKLRLDELQDGVLTVTNYGTSGSRFQTPIIVEGQAGILGAGAIEKRAVVVSQGSPLEANVGDYLAFLPMLTLGFSYDHRILDGATADAFCAAVKKELEGWK